MNTLKTQELPPKKHVILEHPHISSLRGSMIYKAESISRSFPPRYPEDALAPRACYGLFEIMKTKGNAIKATELVRVLKVYRKNFTPELEKIHLKATVQDYDTDDEDEENDEFDERS